MMKYIIPGLILAGAIIFGAIQNADSQVYNGPPEPTALVCAYNASGPPIPTPGQFYYIQCNSSGQIIVE